MVKWVKVHDNRQPCPIFQPLCSIFPNWHNRRLEATALASPSLASKRARLNLGVSQLRLWACAVKTDPHVDSRCYQKGVATICGPYQGIWSKKSSVICHIWHHDSTDHRAIGRGGIGKWKWKMEMETEMEKDVENGKGRQSDSILKLAK